MDANTYQDALDAMKNVRAWLQEKSEIHVHITDLISDCDVAIDVVERMHKQQISMSEEIRMAAIERDSLDVALVTARSERDWLKKRQYHDDYAARNRADQLILNIMVLANEIDEHDYTHREKRGFIRAINALGEKLRGVIANARFHKEEQGDASDIPF